MVFLSENSNSIILGLFLFLILILAWLIFLHFRLSRIKAKQKVLFSGKSGKDLETILHEAMEQTKATALELEKTKKALSEVDEMAHIAIQKVEVLRFNPFKETGGDLSFAIALLDAQNNGVVISSLHGREGTRVYAKPIEDGKSKYNLSDEEEEVLKKVITNN